MPASSRILLVAAALSLGFVAPASAVSAVGKPTRVDKDPGGTPIYGIHVYQVARTAPGGFGIAWNQINKIENPQVNHRIGFRVYDKTFEPVAKPAFADLTRRTAPFIVRPLPLGSDKLLLVFAGKAPPKHIDDPGERQIMAHVISLANGKAGPRKRLDNKATGDETVIHATSLQGGRALVAWYQDYDNEDIVGRFISAAGTPGATNLQFACCNGADLLWLSPLGSGFVGMLRHTSIFDASDVAYGQVYKSNGAKLGAPKDLKLKHGLAPIVRTLDNGRILVMKYIQASGHYKLTAQLYDQEWSKVGPLRTLIPDVTGMPFIEFAPTPDGGLLLGQLIQNGSKYTRMVTRLNTNLQPVGASYSLASDSNDFFRLAALSASRAVLVFRKIKNSRSQLFFQIVSY